MTKKYEVEEFVAEDGARPFGKWLLALRDKVGQAKIIARVDRAAHGNFGDWKAIQGVAGLFELREHYGPGYRIFYTIQSGRVIVLLAASTKKDQGKMIKVAAARLAEYKHRNEKDEEETK